MSDIVNELLYELFNLLKLALFMPIFFIIIYNIPICMVYLFGVRWIGFELVHEKRGKRFVNMGAKELIPMTIIVTVISTLMYLGLYQMYQSLGLTS